MPKKQHGLNLTLTQAVLKRNLGDSSGQNVFFSYGTGCLGANGLFNFLSVPTWMWKFRESLDYDFFQGVFVSSYIFPGGKFAQL